MELLILHYHLHPGGVTKMISNQILALRSVGFSGSIKILCGNTGDYHSLQDTAVFSEPLLDYSPVLMSAPVFSQTVKAIKKAIRRYLKPEVILHCHNPNLGKNPALTMAMYELVREGTAVVNHCHDFAEDRPMNLSFIGQSLQGYSDLPFSEIFYPREPGCHFVVLNGCDLDRIRIMGIPSSQIHLMPNPVVYKEPDAHRQMKKLKKDICQALHTNGDLILCTYPVRAIERKNLGELILMAVLFKDVANFVVTQAPKNPSELQQYNRWKNFCRQHCIAVIFEAGEVVNYENLVTASDFCITTSIREGFGLAYLEPWMSGTPVIGRELSCVTDDLRKQGIIFPRLYHHLYVEEKVDFKDLSFETQATVIVKALNNKDYRATIMSDNPFLNTWLEPVPDEIIEFNRSVVHNRFSIHHYGERLFEIYRSISA